MDAMATILDHVVDIGVNVLKENIKNVQEEKELRCRLRDYLNCQHKYNFNCTIEEEIDFQGLAEYIVNELLEDVKLRLFGTDVQRGIARQSIMDKASIYAQSKTHISDKRARQMVTDALDIAPNGTCQWSESAKILEIPFGCQAQCGYVRQELEQFAPWNEQVQEQYVNKL